MFKREYVVQLVAEATHEYTINALSEEDAVSEAESRYTREDYGNRLGFDVVMADGFCGDDEEDFE
jgi:hypothetical protein